MKSFEEAIQLLEESRTKRIRRNNLPDAASPKSFEEAYAIQDALVKVLIGKYGGHLAGYKIGCSNESAQQRLKVNKPFYGRLLSTSMHASPVRLATNDFFMRVVEPEFAFEMSRDLPLADAPYDVEKIASSVGAVLPSIEVADSRFNEWITVGVFSLIADNGCDGAWVYGERCRDWTILKLNDIQIKLIINDEEVSEGSGIKVMGDPLNALTWLVSELCKAGHEVKAGDIVTTGVCTEAYFAQAGDKVLADFGLLGTVKITFSDI